jgi:hypothetical protein
MILNIVDSLLAELGAYEIKKVYPIVGVNRWLQ